MTATPESKMKNLHNTSMSDVRSNTPDINITGNPGAWVCLCKASSKQDGWMKSTKGLEVPSGVVLQTTTEFRNDVNEVTACTDALVFVPNVSLKDLEHMTE